MRNKKRKYIKAIAFSTAAASFSLHAYADCQETLNSITNVLDVDCSGITTGNYLSNSSNAFSINADIFDQWSYSGLLQGRLGFFNIQDYAGDVNINLSGSIIWSDYKPYNSSGTAGVVNVTATGASSVRRPENINFKSTSNALIQVDLNDGSLLSDPNFPIAAILIQDKRTTDNPDGIYIESNGLIKFNANINSSTKSSYYGIYSISEETDVDIRNHGRITLESKGSHSGTFFGITVISNDKSRGDETINITNSGAIAVNASDISQANIGVYIQADGEHQSITINNSGTIKINGGASSDDYAIFVRSDNDKNIFNINNTANGFINVNNKDQYSIFAANDARLNIENKGVINGKINASSNSSGLNDYLLNSGKIDGDINLQSGNDKFIITSGQVIGNLDMGSGEDEVYLFSGAFEGNIILGDDDDYISINGGDFSKLKNIDAGNGNEDRLDISAQLNAYSGRSLSSAHSTKIENFEIINIFNNGVFNLTGSTLLTNELSIGAGGSLTFDGMVNIASISGNVSNSGLIDLNRNNINSWREITTLGDYQGNGGTINVGTMWNETGNPNGVSYVDHFHILGDVTGQTLVIAKSGIVGTIKPKNYDQYSDYVISVDGNVDASAFSGYASTVNAGEAQLVFDPGVNKFSWMLSASDENEIYSPDVPGYVLTPYINIEMVRDSISTYRDRIGGEYNKAYQFGGDVDNRMWARTWHKHMKGHGAKRLDWKSFSSGYQFGYELENKTVENGSIRTDAYASYVRSSNTAYDRLSSEAGQVISNKFAGNMHVHNVNLGMTRTYTGNDNSYKDIVVQFSNIKNHYNGRRGGKAKNKAWAATASFEQGKEFNISERWYVEPMYQIMVNYLSINDFNDGMRDVSQGNHWDGLLRTGGRLYFRDPINEAQNNLLYMKAHYVRDFSNNGKANIGASYITEKNSKQWVEFGLGFQVNGSKNTHFFMDASIDRNLGGAYRNTYQVQFGISHKW